MTRPNVLTLICCLYALHGCAHDAARVELQHALKAQRQGDVAQAVERLERLRERSGRQADALNQLGVIHATQGDWAVGLEEFVSALKSEPGHGAARFNQVVARMQLGDPEGALRLLEGAPHPERESVRYAVALASAHLALGHSERSLLAITPQLSVATKTTDRVAIGRLLARLERWREVLSVLAAEDEPGEPAASELKRLKALALLHLDRPVEALATLGVGAEPVDGQAVEASAEHDLLLARLYLASGEHAKALTVARELLVERPADVAATVMLGLAHWEGGALRAARTAFAQAAQQADSSIAAYNLALCELRLGDLRAGLKAAERALVLAPGDAEIVSLVAHLQQFMPAVQPVSE